jgi:hypothetical protein
MGSSLGMRSSGVWEASVTAVEETEDMSYANPADVALVYWTILRNWASVEADGAHSLPIGLRLDLLSTPESPERLDEFQRAERLLATTSHVERNALSPAPGIAHVRCPVDVGTLPTVPGGDTEPAGSVSGAAGSGAAHYLTLVMRSDLPGGGWRVHSVGPQLEPADLHIRVVV